MKQSALWYVDKTIKKTGKFPTNDAGGISARRG